MPSNLFMVLSCGHNGKPRSFDDQYVGQLPPGYIGYKINTAQKPGKRDLSAYAGSGMLAVNSILSISPQIHTFESGPKDFPYIKSKHSLVKKHLDREKWDKLKNIKTRTLQKFLIQSFKSIMESNQLLFILLIWIQIRF